MLGAGMVFLCLVSSGTPGHGRAVTHLDEATAAIERLDLDIALQEARLALESGDALPDDSWRIHALLGEIAASMGHRAEAIASFRRALLLRPAYAPLSGASPRVLEPFELARARLGGQRLETHVSSKASADGRIETTALVDGDSEGLVHGARLYVQGQGGAVRRTSTEGASGRFRLDWTCEAPSCSYSVAFADRYGNEVQAIGPDTLSTLIPLPIREPAASPVQVERQSGPQTKPWFRRPLPYVMAATAFAVAGAILTGQFVSTQGKLEMVTQNRSQYTLSNAVSLDAARKSDYGWMWASWGSAAASTGVAVWVW